MKKSKLKTIKDQELNYKLPKYLLFFLIILEGYLSITVEVLSIRTVVPYVGSNIINTSIIIGIFLLFLSLGYYKGGSITKNFETILLNNLIKSGIIFSIGFSNIFVQIFFNLLISIGINSYFVLILYTLAIISPIIYLLGQTIPISINFVNSSQHSKVNGLFLFLSTLGSFSGSIITSVILFNYIGIYYTTLFIITIFLILIIMFYKYSYQNIKDKKIKLKIIVFILLSILFNPMEMFLKTNSYSNIKIYEQKNTKYLNINNSNSSSYNKKQNNSTFEYIKKIQKYINKDLNIKNKEILVIGAGGFTLSLKNQNKNNYTYIDIDKDLKNISGDIRQLIINKKIAKKQDIIIIDVYTNKTSIPYFLLTRNFLQQLKTILKQNGYIIFNIIGKPDFSSNNIRHINQTINSELNCLIIPNKFI